MNEKVCAWLAAAVVVMAACDRRPLVGVIVPESGAAAVYGASVKSGVRLALASSTSDADLPFIVEYRDSRSEPNRAASLAAALYGQGAVVIIGGVTTAEAKAMIPLAQQHERVLLSPSASAPELTRESGFFFRVYPSDELEGVRAADLFAVLKNARSVLIIQEDNDYTRGLLHVFVAELTNRGGRVAGTTLTQSPGWQQEVRHLLATQPPDGVYVCGYGDAILEALRVLRAAAYSGTICTTSAIGTSTLVQRAGELAEGVYFPLVGFDAQSREEPVKSFVRSYRDSYDLTPDIYAAHGYDAGLAVRYALAKLDGGPASGFRAALAHLEGVRGVTGPLAFDDLGDVKHSLFLHRIVHGRVELAEPTEPGGSAKGETRSTTTGVEAR